MDFSTFDAFLFMIAAAGLNIIVHVVRCQVRAARAAREHQQRVREMIERLEAGSRS